MIKLYGYWRSSAAYRVRIALNLKQVPHEHCPVHLIRDGGEQHCPDYRALNPQQLVPLLVDGDFKLNQSMAILEYLEERYPDPPLLPSDLQRKAQVRALCQMIVADIHPLNNLRVLQYLGRELSISENDKSAWYRHWIQAGFQALEQQLAPFAQEGSFSFGNQATLADLCLIPQLYNAYRFGCSTNGFLRLEGIYRHCSSLEGFREAAPERQPDAQPPVPPAP